MKLAVALSIFLASAFAAPPNGRIIGGHNAEKGQFPYQVSVEWSALGINSFEHNCGGTILNNNWILTAGHCIIGMDGPMRVRAGTNLKHEGGQTVDVAERIVHPDYHGEVGPNDIALLRLSSPLNFNELVSPAALPKADEIPTGDAVLSGWGATSTSYPNDLQTAVLPLLSIDECAEALINIIETSKHLDKTNVCSGPLNDGIGACSGDSGGPLAQGKTVIGVVSWGIIPCGIVGAPSVYVRVSAFLDFINEHVK